MRWITAVLLLVALASGCGKTPPRPSVPPAPAPVDAPAPVVVPPAPEPAVTPPPPPPPPTVETAPDRSFQGEMPRLERVTPGGARSVVAALDAVPERLSLAAESGRVRVQIPPRSYWVDVTTGAVENDGRIMSGGHDYGWPIWAGWGGGPTAELVGSDGTIATLVITREGRELYRLPDWIPLRRPEPAPCYFGGPEGAWRPDGRVFAVTAFPAPGQAELWLFDPATRETSVAASLDGLKRVPSVTWAPDGAHVAFGRTVLRADGEPLGVPGGDLVRWSDDGKRFLATQVRKGNWGRIALVDVAAATTSDLGWGWALGFTAAGDAVFAAWEAARSLPAGPCG